MGLFLASTSAEKPTRARARAISRRSPANVSRTAPGNSRSHCHLDDTFAPLAEQCVRFSNILELERVRQERCQIDALGPHELHQASHAFLTARAQRGDHAMIA